MNKKEAIDEIIKQIKKGSFGGSLDNGEGQVIGWMLSMHEWKYPKYKSHT